MVVANSQDIVDTNGRNVKILKLVRELAAMAIVNVHLSPIAGDARASAIGCCAFGQRSMMSPSLHHDECHITELVSYTSPGPWILAMRIHTYRVRLVVWGHHSGCRC